MTKENRKDYQTADKCHMYNELWDTEDVWVRGHCHVTGKSKVSAHKSCDLNFRVTFNLFVVFHNHGVYDSHL